VKHIEVITSSVRTFGTILLRRIKFIFFPLVLLFFLQAAAYSFQPTPQEGVCGPDAENAKDCGDHSTTSDKTDAGTMMLVTLQPGVAEQCFGIIPPAHRNSSRLCYNSFDNKETRIFSLKKIYAEPI